MSLNVGPSPPWQLGQRLVLLPGVKAADAILKKHPDHGETLCMKALNFSGSPG